MNNNLLNVSEDAMFKLIASMPNSTHIKNTQNGQYITTNKHNLKMFGFTQESEFIGLTLDELNNFMQPYWGKEFAEKVFLFDEKVKLSGNTEVMKNLIFKDRKGESFKVCKQLLKKLKPNS